MPGGIGEIFTIRLLAHPVNAEMRSSFVGRHISATFELRADVVKAEARRVERSESLRRRALLDADQCDGRRNEYGDRNHRRNRRIFHERSATSTERRTHSQSPLESPAVLMAVCDTGTGA
jgi:hypothetical protein